MGQPLFGTRGWTPDNIGNLTGKTYVITGASAGAGLEAAKILLTKGAKVVMLNRSAPKSEAVVEQLKADVGADADVSYIQMDLASLESVRTAAAAVLAKLDQIDALICNAAIAQVATQEFTVDGFESQLGVNHFGHFLLCGLLFDRIEASTGRMVMVGSNAYKMGLKRIKFEDLNFDDKYSAWDSYAQSKLAQMMFGFELQRRIEAAGKSTRVYVCHPGASRTDLMKDKASPMMKIIWALISPMAQSAEKGAWPEVMCATQPDLKNATLYGPTKMADTTGPVGTCTLEANALDAEAANKLWALSEEKTGLTWSLA